MNRATTFRHSRKLHQTVGYVTYTSDDTPKPKMPPKPINKETQRSEPP
jgi:hypothetical protein